MNWEKRSRELAHGLDFRRSERRRRVRTLLARQRLFDSGRALIARLKRRGIAIMAAREGLSFECEITSDCAPLAGLINALIEARIEIHCLRDPTRGGLASALVEIAEAARVNIKIDEIAIPVREDVRGTCEILGFDPLYLANEGRFVAFLASPDAAGSGHCRRRARRSSASAARAGTAIYEPVFTIPRPGPLPLPT